MTGPGPARGPRQLDALAERLAPRDWAILADLERFRLADSTQIRRLHVTGHASTPAAVRATNQTLRRLAMLGVVAHLDARVGGFQGGSHSYVWHLTSAGARLAARHHDPSGRAVIRHQPSLRMADHTLAVTETAVALREQAAAGALELLTLETEPDCWRDWLDGAGVRRVLKPDLFSVTAATGAAFEQLWFLEIDQGTESVATLAAKAAAYAAYQASGTPILRHGVMPRVAWITPDERRAQTVARAATSGDRSGAHQAMTLPRFIAAVTETSTGGSPPDGPPP